MESLLLMVAMIAVFYFLIIRPENKRKKQAEQMRSSLKKGDRVTTIGGMVGKIVQVNDSTIVFETSEGGRGPRPRRGDQGGGAVHRRDGAGCRAEERQEG